jgi:hypothetical protein
MWERKEKGKYIEGYPVQLWAHKGQTADSKQPAVF